MDNSVKGRVIKGVYVAAFGYFTVLMLLITLQYIPVDLSVAFLRIKTAEIALPHYQIAFFAHIYSSILVHIIGFLQFSTWLRLRHPSWHAGIGKAYVFLILCVAGPSGLVMAYYANGGISAQIAFSLLAIGWLYFTWKGWQKARERSWEAHQNFMLRSYALTLSAVSLRLFKWIIVNTMAPPPMDTYRFVAWAGWVVNLLVVELYLLNRMSVRSLPDKVKVNR